MPLTAIDNQDDLLARVSEGSQKAFTELFYAYHNQLAEFVLMLTGSREQTQEIIQDVFMKVWEQRTHLPTVEDFLSWLFILTRNHTLNSLRKAASERRRVFLTSAEAFEAGSADDRIIDKDYHDLFERAVAQLPPQQRKAYKMSRIEGLGNDYIGKVLGVAPESVKKYLQWAQQSVTQYVRSHIGFIVFFFINTRL